MAIHAEPDLEQVERLLFVIRQKVKVAKESKEHGYTELLEYSIKTAEEMLETVERMIR